MHIQRPEVRIVEPQQEEVKSNEVSGYEANQLLAKYGYSDPLVNNHPPVYNPDNNLTAEQLFQKQLKEEQEKKQREMVQLQIRAMNVANQKQPNISLGIPP